MFGMGLTHSNVGIFLSSVCLVFVAKPSSPDLLFLSATIWYHQWFDQRDLNKSS